MSASVLVCLAPGSEEIEAVTAIDLLVRAGIHVTTASVAGDGNLEIRCSRGVRILADVTLVEVADDDFDVIVLPGGLGGATCFSESPLLVEKVRQNAHPEKCRRYLRCARAGVGISRLISQSAI